MNIFKSYVNLKIFQISQSTQTFRPENGIFSAPI